MRVLVTGATGFVGSRLVPHLLSAGHEVVAVVRRREAAVPGPADVVQVDLAQPLEPDRLPAADAVIHLAQANVPFPDAAPELYAVNTAATLGLLDHARRSGARVFVHASSGSVYGAGEARRSEEDSLRGEDFYALTKRHAEQLVGAYAELLVPVVLRLFAPYGPGQRARLIPSLIDRVRDGSAVTLNDGGRPRLTPVYIDDVVDVFVRSLNAEEPVVANVAGDEIASIADLATEIGRLLGREPTFEHVHRTSAGDVLGDNRRMREAFGVGELVPLATGLAKTVEEQ
jgi:UDP-glucose 4-epimerase